MKSNLLLLPENTLKEALKKINKNRLKTAVVIDSRNNLLGLINDGIIRRALIKNAKLNEKIKRYFTPRNKIHFVYRDKLDLVKTINLIKKKDLNLVPVVDNKLKVVDFLHKNTKTNSVLKKGLNIPLIIMCGGMGLRMKPFTNILPKPLLPIKDKTILDEIISGFNKYGIKNFFITIFYKSEIIKAYLNELRSLTKLNIKFIVEKKLMGTCGSLFYLKKKIKKKDFIVTNCDTLINFDINKVYGFHLKSKNIMTIISSNKNVKIPYGVLEIKRKKYLGKIIEKPQYNFNINTGVYLFNKKIFNYFKKEKKIDINDLINLLIKNNESIGVYSIKNTEWNDLGNWKEYQRFNNKKFL